MPRKDKPLTVAQRASQAALARRNAQFDEAAALKAQGHSYQHIAKIMGAGRKTVERWLRQGHAPVWTPSPRSSIVAPYAAYLNKRQAEGCRNASQLWREIVALGFPGKFSIVHQWLGPRRQKLLAQNTPSRVTAPLGRKLAQLLLANPTSLPEAENDFIARLFSAEPALAAATTWTGKMQALLRKKSDAGIDRLLDEGEQTLLSNFVTGLRRDINAIKAALDTPWTTSPVEGQISRLKMLKRPCSGVQDSPSFVRVSFIRHKPVARFVRKSHPPGSTLNGNQQVCGLTTMRHSSQTYCARSTSRQRTTPHRRRRAVLHHRYQRLPLLMVQPWRRAWGRAINQPLWAVRIEPQHPVAHDLQPDGANPCRIAARVPS